MSSSTPQLRLERIRNLKKTEEQLSQNNNCKVLHEPLESQLQACKAQRDVRYLGCYVDREQRAMTDAGFRGTWNDCRRRAERDGMRFFALQHGYDGNNAECYLSNSKENAQRYGVGDACIYTDTETRKNAGGTWRNAIYESA